MTTTTEPYAALGKAHLDVAARLAAVAADSTEKLFDLQVRTARTALTEVTRTARTLGEARSVADLPAWASAQPMADKATAYGRSVYEIAAEARAGIVRRPGSGIDGTQQAMGRRLQCRITGHAGRRNPGAGMEIDRRHRECIHGGLVPCRQGPGRDDGRQHGHGLHRYAHSQKSRLMPFS